MKKHYTIEQKMSGTGSIHSVASDICDRVIVFEHGCQYAVVAAAHYGLSAYSTHKTPEAAIKAMNTTWRNHSAVIIDTAGNSYNVIETYHGGRLEMR